MNALAKLEAAEAAWLEAADDLEAEREGTFCQQGTDGGLCDRCAAELRRLERREAYAFNRYMKA